MNAPNDTSNYPYEQPFSFASWLNGWVVKIKKAISANFKLVLLAVLIGAALGLAYSIFKPVRYNAEITFSVEDSKSIGGGLLSSLGGSIGMDIGSLAGSGNGVLSGDNVLSLLKSKSMMAQCLKTPYPIDNNTSSTNAAADSNKQSAIANYTIADRYADVYGLREKWTGNEKIGRAIYFGQPDQNVRLQDSLLKTIIKRIEEKELSVVKPDKKLSFFKIAINTKDELLSLLITKGIIKIATDFYVNAKVGRLRNNIERLEKRTDSISNLLNQQTYSATEDARLLLNVNPADINAPVYSEISQRDKMVLTTIYAELMKNLELSKAALIQETPTVQIVDQTGFPLERIETKWYEGIFLGAILSFLGITALLLFRQPD
ncbi:MAG: Wzz/FepE/Etk N-terminal domain-containing protein [Sediminibacterium sp.]